MNGDVVAGIIICGNRGLVLKDKQGNLFLPKFDMPEKSRELDEKALVDEALETFCTGIRRVAGIKRDYLMFLKVLGSTKLEIEKRSTNVICLLLKAFFYELPESYREQEMSWVDLRELRKVLTNKDERNFCTSKNSEIYNAKYDMRHSPPKYPRDGIRW